MRLKPEEASALLQEDGDEMRVGGISLQIMAEVCRTNLSGNHDSGTGQRDPLAVLNMDKPAEMGKSEAGRASAAGTDCAAPCTTGGAASAGPRSSPGVSVTLGFKRRMGMPGRASSAIAYVTVNGISGRADDKPDRGLAGSSAGLAEDADTALAVVKGAIAKPPSTMLETEAAGGNIGPARGRQAFKPLVSTLVHQAAGCADGSTKVASAVANAGEDRSPNNSAFHGSSAGGTKKPTRFLSQSRGSGGARRFHAPRPSGSALTGAVGGVSLAVAGVRSITGPVRPGLAANCRGGSIAIGSGSSGPGGGGGITHDSDAAATCSRPATVVHPEDLVLEWTKGDRPQPIRVGATLARRLHLHQRDGLKVLWECLAGRGG